MAASASEVQKAPLKRPLFNKPAWSRPQKVASPAEFFHRSSSAYADVAAEAERKRKAKLAKREAERAKAETEATVNGDAKRQRISSDSDDDSDGTSDQSDRDNTSKQLSKEKERQISVISEGQNGARATIPPKREPSPKTLSKRYESCINVQKAEAEPKQNSSNIIDLEDSGDEMPASDDGDDCKMIQPKKAPPPEEDEFPASDDEYAELARKAREKARRKRLEEDIISATHKASPSLEPEGHSQRSLSAPQQPAAPPPPDPEVHILITSPLDNTKPLIVKRKLSQRLKDVRVAWCQYQQFTPDMSDTIFLTWRCKRLFDVTTCKGLGIAVDEDGNVSSKGETRLFGEEEQKLHMEAMTAGLFEERKKAKQRKMQEEQDGINEEEETMMPQKPEEPQVRIILKAKGFDDFKLKVKAVSHTRISAMLWGL